MSMTIKPNNPAYTATAENGRQDKTATVRSGTIYMGNQKDDNVRIPGSRLAAAQKKSMKMILDQFHNDLALDQGLAERAAHQEELQQKIVDNHKKISQIDETIASYREQFGITEETPGENYPEEYIQLVSGLEAEKSMYQYELDPSNPDNLYLQERREQYMISDIKLERLKADPMYDTRKEADEIIGTAQKDLIRELMDEVKEHTDEQMETKWDEARTRKSEKEKQDEELLAADTEKGKNHTELKKYIEEQHIIDEDALGIAVDQRL